jgi:hypothetical protein
MRKVKIPLDELRREYKRSDFAKLQRGKYYERVKECSNVVVLDQEVAAVFSNSDAVNKALHSLVEVAESVSRVASRRPHTGRHRRSGYSRQAATGRRIRKQDSNLGRV